MLLVSPCLIDCKVFQDSLALHRSAFGLLSAIVPVGAPPAHRRNVPLDAPSDGIIENSTSNAKAINDAFPSGTNPSRSWRRGAIHVGPRRYRPAGEEVIVLLRGELGKTSIAAG